ncbi:hypothetical protein BDV12DRAFT_209951 [Aspergillus spectabilis]
MATSIEQYVSHFDGPSGLKKVKVPIPSPGPGEVLVKISAVSLNYRDVEVIRGDYIHHKSVNQGSEITPCSDMAGTVTKTGAGVLKWKPGDRVLSTFVPAHKTGKLTEEALKSSLRLPQPGTAWMAINGPRPLGELGAKDQYILLQGTGGVSVAGLLLGKALGVKVIITSSSSEKLCTSKDLDIILETGGLQTLGKSFSCAAYGGLINWIGYTSGKTQAAGEQPNVNVLTISRCLTLKGFVNGPTDRFEEMVRFSGEHQIHPVVCKVFGYGEAREAFEYMEGGSHFGKIVIKVN